MLKGFGEMIAAIIGALMPWLVLTGVPYVGIVYGWPRAETFWNQREAAYAAQPKLLAVIAQDKLDLAAAKANSHATAARATRNDALLSRFASAPQRPGAPPGLAANEITELLQ